MLAISVLGDSGDTKPPAEIGHQTTVEQRRAMHGNDRETARTVDILVVNCVSQIGRKICTQAIVHPCINWLARFVAPLLPCRKNPVILSPDIIDHLDTWKTRREHTVQI